MIWALGKYAGRLWQLNDAYLVLTSPQSVKKIFSTPLHHERHKSLIQGRMDPCFHVVHTGFTPYHLNVAAGVRIYQSRQCFLIFCCPILENNNLSFLLLAGRSGIQCGLLL